MRLLVEIPEHLFAELELFLGDTALRRLDFTRLLRLVDPNNLESPLFSIGNGHRFVY